ncbi:hypothetical protein EWB00_000803 [Schistosoma japonicum]|uniref:Uncharacterized protein n=2 Tax=Schistosoma japonicum TaxID=6182 RepID=A0A4Z2DHT3_SCHJA|nr:hypothetical protein EWB00_000803 [Schistosoma japonicum]
MDASLSQLTIECQHISNATKEIEFLSLLRTHANNCENAENHNPITGLSEINGTKSFFKILSRISRDCGGLWTVNEDLDWLMFYLFARCYGWGDTDLNDVRSQILAPSTGRRYRNLSKEEELTVKDKVIQITSEIIFLIRSLPLSLAGLKMFISSINLARGMHHTRKQIAIHTIDWLTFGLRTDGGGVKAVASPRFTNKSSVTQPFLPEDATPETMFMTVKDLIWNCCTDNSRGIRIGTLAALYGLFGQLSTNTIVRLIKLTSEILEKPEVCASEATEGVIDILSLLMRRLVPSEQLCYSRIPITGSTLASQTNLSVCKFSTEYVQNQLFPRLRAAVTNLFYSNHLIVRRAAVRVYLTCLNRCQNEIIQEVLLQTTTELCSQANKSSVIYKDNYPSNFGNWRNSPYFTESLLSLCRCLIKKVGEGNLPPNTGDLQNCLVNFYLGHSSHYVRSSACRLYLTLFISASKNLNRVRYLLNKILENWKVNRDIVLSPLPKVQVQTDGVEIITTPREMPMVVHSKGLTLSLTWCDGRMRIYCFIAHALVGLHLKVLHELGTDGCSPLNYEEFCISPTVTDNCSQKTLDSSFSNNSLQPVLSPAPKSDSTILVLNADRRPSIMKPVVSLVDSSPTFYRQRTKSGSSQQSVNLTILESIRMFDNEREEKQSDSNRTSSWIHRLSMVPGLASTSKTNVSRLELNSLSVKTMLTSMLHLAVECILDENNGLRCSAKKAIYSVGRLIRWYNADVLLEMISLHLVGPPTVMSYATMKLLRDSLLELCRFDEILQKEEEEPGFTEKYALFGNVPILNVPLLYGLFSPDGSRLWLRCCQQYSSDNTMPLFIGILSAECALRTLCLVHRLSNLSLVACTWESMRPDPFLDVPYSQHKLDVDANDVAGCIKGFVNFAQRIDVKLGPTHEPVLNVGNYQQMMTTLKPYLSCLQHSHSTEKDQKRKLSFPKNSLTYFILKLVTKLESVMYSYLPPSLTPKRPNPNVRRTGGLLLSPILPYIITWPLALLPPSLDNTQLNPPDATRILSVRKLLRLVAAIILALPLSNQPEFQQNELNRTNDGLLLEELTSIAEYSVDLTTVVNAYFAQLENLILQLNQYYEPTRICTTVSWWWVRALCEHLPRLVQIAPLSNPINILTRLIDDVRARSRFSAVAKQNAELQRVGSLKWTKALEYSRQKAKSKMKIKEASGVIKYQWPNVKEILQSKDAIEKQHIIEKNFSTDPSISPTDEEQHLFFVTSDNEEDETDAAGEGEITSSSDNDIDDEEEQNSKGKILCM